MQRWEYKRVTLFRKGKHFLHGDKEVPHVSSWLNEFGEDGWELVSLLRHVTDIDHMGVVRESAETHIFKRPYDGPPRRFPERPTAPPWL